MFSYLIEENVLLQIRIVLFCWDVELCDLESEDHVISLLKKVGMETHELLICKARRSPTLVVRKMKRAVEFVCCNLRAHVRYFFETRKGTMHY